MFQEEIERWECLCLCRFSIVFERTVYIYISFKVETGEVVL